MKYNSRKFERREPNPMPDDRLNRNVRFYAGWMVSHGYDNRDHASFQAITRYMAEYEGGRGQNQSPEYDMPDRGLMLLGARGLGKSEALKRMSALFDIEMIDARDLAWEYQKDGVAAIDAMLSEVRRADLIIDDICNEQETRNFGNSFSMADIIDKRYRLWCDCGNRTFFSTNSTMAEISRRYGEATASRLRGMCDMVEFIGKDRRGER